MAGVLDALASYVTGMLVEMAKEEVAMLIGVFGEIDKLVVKLRDLKNFLADADRRNITDTSVHAWVEELKRAMYDVTDILDLCRLKVMEEGPSKDMGCFNPLLFCMRNPLHSHDIGTRIKTLNQKLDDIFKRGSTFNFIKLEAYQERKMTQSSANDRKTDSLLERVGVIGEKIEEDTRELVEVLTKEGPGDSLMVVAIVGVGGIGKTTLSKKIFNDETIEGKFSKKIWLSITRDFNDVELLSTAITAAGGELPGGGAARDKALLVAALKNANQDKKLFLVLDDMWGADEWNKLLMTPFSYGGPGSRVLITTRHETVCRSVKAVHYHHVDKLAPEDAWTLLKTQVVTSGKEPEVDTLEDIGLQIAAKCDGLPLAIKVMGGLLCKKEKTRRDWEDVLKHDICEGLVHGDSCGLEEEGTENYKELILRNLIEIDTKYPGQFYCNMHDVIRSFAQYLARDEALVAHDGDTAKIKLRSHNFLRLSIETKGVESNGFEWKYLIDQKSLRTLILTGNFGIQRGDSLITFSSLRTLLIEYANIGALVESVCHLKHLRYLSLSNCSDISGLPQNIHEIRFLQHISLFGCKGFVKLPDSIVKLQELRYLDISATNVNNVPRGFRALKNLRSLFGYPAYVDGDWCSLEELGPLSQITGLGLEVLANVSATLSAAEASLGTKAHLTRLDIRCCSRLGDDGLPTGGVSEEEEQRIKMLFDVLCPPTCLEFLNIHGYFGRHLPIWMMRTSTMPFENLRTLFMNELACCTQLPDGLCRLPCLAFLRVRRAPAIKRVGPEFVQPYNHHHHGSSQAVAAFPNLHSMNLVSMVQWEEWEWEEEVQAMPTLENLHIKHCKLSCIPRGLSFYARCLKRLDIRSVKRLRSLDNFATVIELKLYANPDLTRVSNFPKLEKFEIDLCPKLELLQEMTALRRLVLVVGYSEERLPLYLQTVKASHVQLNCSLKVLASMAAGKFGSEWDKFSHIQHVEAYADDGDIQKKWHLFYTSEPYSLETNINLLDFPDLTVMSSGVGDELVQREVNNRLNTPTVYMLGFLLFVVAVVFFGVYIMKLRSEIA